MELPRIVIGFALLLALAGSGCARQSASPSGPTQSVPEREAPTTVYLVPETGGHLSAKDLATHHEVEVVHDQASLMSAASTRTAIWIDSSSSGSVDWTWVAERGWELYPVAFVGQNAEAALSGKLQLRGLFGSETSTPGFTVWIVVPKEVTGTTQSGWFLRGYAETPTVEGISELTGAALQGDYSWLPHK